MRYGLGFLTRKIFSFLSYSISFWLHKQTIITSKNDFYASLWYNLSMKSNLFFEGPARTGKSTVLRKTLLPMLSDLGGFFVQRLVDSNGIAVAYQLVSLDEIKRLGTKGESLFLSVDAPYAPSHPTDHNGIFLWTAPRRFDTNVFETFGVDCLKASTNKVILLDEIGGVDLLCPGFLAALRTVLSSDTPCIGVLKELEKARDAQSLNRELRALLTVKPLSSENLSTIPDQVHSFLHSKGI
jgi:nucleoside-triphosphatase THEP1